jgi:hypothetical protein
MGSNLRRNCIHPKPAPFSTRCGRPSGLVSWLEAPRSCICTCRRFYQVPSENASIKRVDKQRTCPPLRGGLSRQISSASLSACNRHIPRLQASVRWAGSKPGAPPRSTTRGERPPLRRRAAPPSPARPSAAKNPCQPCSLISVLPVKGRQAAHHRRALHVQVARACRSGSAPAKVGHNGCTTHSAASPPLPSR